MTAYLVTGHRGVVASRFAASRVRAGDSVDGIDDGKDPRHQLNASPGIHEYPVRLGAFVNPHGTPSDIGDIVTSADRVLHAAASTGIPYSGQAPLDDWSRNVDGTLEILEAVRRAPKPTVILSSVKPYGLQALPVVERNRYVDLGRGCAGVDESYPLVPDEPYAASKAAQSLISQAYARSYDLPIVIFRCSNLYGPAAPHGARHGWLTWFCIRAALGWTIEIQGDGKQTRDVLFWSDVESAAIAAFEALEAGKVERGSIFNLGGGPDNLMSPLSAVNVLREMGAKFEVRFADGRKHEDRLFCTNTAKLNAALGWGPKVGTFAGMEQVYDWACDNREALARVYEGER